MDTNFDAQFANRCQWGSTKSIALIMIAYESQIDIFKEMRYLSFI